MMLLASQAMVGMSMYLVLNTLYCQPTNESKPFTIQEHKAETLLGKVLGVTYSKFP